MKKISFRDIKPTKTNLIKLQKKLDFAVKGESFLEYTIEQLMIQIKIFWIDYQLQRKNFLNLFRKLLIELNQTYKEMGKNNVIKISKLSRIQYKTLIHLKYMKDKGSIYPNIDLKFKKDQKFPAYSFSYTSPHLDYLIIILKLFFKNLISYIEIEDRCLKSSLNYKKINRRKNGYKHLIIPQLQKDIKKIKELLEENERESYIRLKKTKNLINKNGNYFYEVFK
ncbi:MAG: V-type ATP synthase subunit D [Promethearchaeota archaeon]